MALKQHNLTCTGHTRPVVFLNFSGITDGKYYLISACKDGKPMLRQGETGDWIGTFEGHKGAVWGAALNVDASKAATGAADFSAKLWDATNGSELASLPHRHIVKSVSFSSDSSQLVTGSNEKLMRIFDLNRLDAEPLKINGHTSSIRHALFLNDDRWLLSASDDKTIRLWDLKSLQEIQRLEFSSIPNDLELSADKNLLTVASANSVSFHEINGLNKIKEYQVPTIVYTASLSPDKAVFVCGGEDFTMYKYQFEDGTELDSFKGHFGPLHCIRFSPDGELYASASEDGTIRLWQTVIGKTYGLWSQSPLNDHMLKAMDSYESYIGVKEIKKIQQNVLKAEEAFIESSKARRTIQDGLLKVQQNLKQIRSKLDSMSRSDEAYLELITNEHKFLKNEMSLLNELRTKEESERELFTSFSQRLREAHEFERLRQEKVKYLSILGSIIGAFLGILGTSINHALKMKDINKLVNTLEKQMNTFSAFSAEISSHLSPGIEDREKSTIESCIEQNLNNLSQAIIKEINTSQQTIQASQEELESRIRLNNLIIVGLFALFLPVVMRFASN